MRLLMLNNEYPPIGGGTATANYYVIREMARRGINVDLVTSMPAGSDYGIEKLGPTSTVYRVPIDNQNPHYQSEIELLRFIYRGFYLIRRLYGRTEPTYDLCHAWSGLPGGALALLLKWKRKLPYIVALRGSDVPGYDVRYKWLYPLLKPSLYMIWGNASALTVNSYELRSLARQFRPRDHFEVIPNGVDLARFKHIQPTAQDPDRPIRILCVARLVERKGITDLIDTAAYIRQTHTNFKLVIVGRGDKEAKFKAAVTEQNLEPWIEFKGAVLHDEMPAIYNDADIFVLPSWNEGMSNAVLEAMAAGLPIISTYTGGTAEMLRGNGIIIPKQAPDAIAKAILELWNAPELRITMGQRSREIAETLVWERVVDNYLNLYDRTMSAVKQNTKVRLLSHTGN